MEDDPLDKPKSWDALMEKYPEIKKSTILGGLPWRHHYGLKLKLDEKTLENDREFKVMTDKDNKWIHGMATFIKPALVGVCVAVYLSVNGPPDFTKEWWISVVALMTAFSLVSNR